MENSSLGTQKKLIVIEDCAQTCGGIHRGKTRTWGDFGCFSFQEIKIMTTERWGNGVNYNKFVKDLKTLSYHGWDQDPLSVTRSISRNTKIKHWNYSITKLGFKYNMTDLMAVIGMEQLKKLKSFNLKRTLIMLYSTKKI